jgi:hypothetical protein
MRFVVSRPCDNKKSQEGDTERLRCVFQGVQM